MGEAVESIQNQTFQRFEIIIVDDGSTDSSPEFIRQYARQDPRIRYVSNKSNLGIPKTRNQLLALVSDKSTHVAFLDSDDVAMPQRFEAQLELMESEGLDACGSAVHVIDSESKIIGIRAFPSYSVRLYKEAMVFNPFAQSAMLIKHSTFSIVGGYDERLSRVQDYDLWLRMLKGGVKMSNHERPLTMFRVHSDQGKERQNRKSLLMSIRVRLRYLFIPMFFSTKALLVCLSYCGLVLLPTKVNSVIFKKKFVR